MTAMSSTSTPAAELSTGFGASLWQMTLALVVVCALAAVVLWLLRRRMPGATGPLRVVARLVLDGRHTLYVIDVAGRMLLVGAGEGGLSTLAELSAEQAAAIARDGATGDAGSVLLRRWFGARG